MAIFNSEGICVSNKTFKNAYPNTSFRFPLEQSTLDALNITDFTIGELPVNDNNINVPDAALEARFERDDLLKDSDFTQLPDSPVDSSVWATYRQALRDVPDQDGFPDTIIWPTKPGDE